MVQDDLEFRLYEFNKMDTPSEGLWVDSETLFDYVYERLNNKNLDDEVARKEFVEGIIDASSKHLIHIFHPEFEKHFGKSFKEDRTKYIWSHPLSSNEIYEYIISGHGPVIKYKNKSFEYKRPKEKRTLIPENLSFEEKIPATCHRFSSWVATLLKILSQEGYRGYDFSDLKVRYVHGYVEDGKHDLGSHVYPHYSLDGGVTWHEKDPDGPADAIGLYTPLEAVILVDGDYTKFFKKRDVPDLDKVEETKKEKIKLPYGKARFLSDCVRHAICENFGVVTNPGIYFSDKYSDNDQRARLTEYHILLTR